jgi:hypothetical protein
MENPIRGMKTIYQSQSHSPEANGPDPLRLHFENVAKAPIRRHEKFSTLSRLTEKRYSERYRAATELKTRYPIANGGYKERDAKSIIA